MTHKQAIAWVRKNCKFAIDLTQAPPNWESQDSVMRRSLELQQKQQQPQGITVKRYDTRREWVQLSGGDETAGDPKIENEEVLNFSPDEYDLEEGKTAPMLVAQYIIQNGGNEPSSVPWSQGTWYSSNDSDMRTGDILETSFHIEGATPEQEQEIYKLVTRR